MFNASFRQNVSRATLFQLAAELSWLFAAFLLFVHLGDHVVADRSEAALIALLFAAIIICLNGAFGLYRRSRSLSTGAYLLRVVLAPAIGIPLAFIAAQFIPGTTTPLDDWWWPVALALLGLLLVRHAVVLPLAGVLLPHRVLVLGTGPEARLVEASIVTNNPLGMRLVGFYGLEKSKEPAVSPARVISKGSPLNDVVRQLGVDEIIVAVRQQRGGVLPLRELLDCRLSGVRVTDLARYFERVHGQVPIESLKVSWLIYGEGFRQNGMRNGVKRCLDLVLSAVLLAISLPIVLVVALLIMLEGGGPIIYRQERVGFRGRTFTAYKLRSMALDAEKDGRATWASANDARITRVGKF
ncbi:MAG: sugar transferase, partial [Deltaproteobacteria bacterium]